MLDQSSSWFLLLAGVALLLAGRRLFWLFVGIVGFVAGLRFADAVFDGSPQNHWIVALLCGLVGVFLALFLQRVAVAVTGFLVGGFAAVRLLGLDLAQPGLVPLLVLVVAGVVAALLALLLFNAALIVLSSLAGAGLILDAFALPEGWATLAFVALVILGLVVQARITARRAPPLRQRTA